MTLWRDDPDRAADALIGADDLGLAEGMRVLLVDASAALPETLAASGCAIATWDRRLAHGRGATIAPPAGPFDVVLLRLCKAKDELEMRAHQAFTTLVPGGRLIVYGGNDEGIKAAGKRIEALGPVMTLATRGHGRILSMICDGGGPKSDVAAWRRETLLPCPGSAPRPWITYPGLFADGLLDPATALLLAHVGDVPTQARVLDYGCGTGLIARALLDRGPTLPMTALDADSVAVLATSENVPEARTLLADRLKGSGRFDVIVSNPPIHTGFREDYAALYHLIDDAPKHLLPKGRLVLVVQRRVPIEARLKANFGAVDSVADEGPFRIWAATRAIAPPTSSLRDT